MPRTRLPISLRLFHGVNQIKAPWPVNASSRRTPAALPPSDWSFELFQSIRKREHECRTKLVEEITYLDPQHTVAIRCRQKRRRAPGRIALGRKRTEGRVLCPSIPLSPHILFPISSRFVPTPPYSCSPPNTLFQRLPPVYSLHFHPQSLHLTFLPSPFLPVSLTLSPLTSPPPI